MERKREGGRKEGTHVSISDRRISYPGPKKKVCLSYEKGGRRRGGAGVRGYKGTYSWTINATIDYPTTVNTIRDDEEGGRREVLEMGYALLRPSMPSDRTEEPKKKKRKEKGNGRIEVRIKNQESTS
jgi:hypothetical protein